MTVRKALAGFEHTEVRPDGRAPKTSVCASLITSLLNNGSNSLRASPWATVIFPEAGTPLTRTTIRSTNPHHPM
jgi:hypothetical protein